MQSNCSRKERITVREELIGGKRYIVVSHYAGKKDFKKSSAITLSDKRLQKPITRQTDRTGGLMFCVFCRIIKAHRIKSRFDSEE